MTASVGTEPRELRSYQTAAVAAVERDWESGTKRTGVVLPTGAGKSTVIGKLASNAYRSGKRVVALAHRAELLFQMRRDMLAVDPTIPASDIGIVMAEHDDHHAPIVFASLQTLAHAKRRNALGRRDVILWDEFHHAGAEGFHATFEELGGYTHAYLCGFTATMYRNEKGTIGLGDVIQKVSYEKDLRWAIKHGFLVQPRGKTVRIKNLDKLDDVRTVAGDFKNDELAEVMEAAVEYVVDAIELHARERTNIVFAASVDGAHMIADAINERGMTAEAVTGSMPHAEREQVYDRYRTGVTKNLVTVMVLTEGADFPMCDTVVMARPTRSKNLYAQMVGRALRLFPGKTDALVLDLSGSTRAMKLVNLTDLSPGAPVEEVDEQGQAIAVCPTCDLYVTECVCGLVDDAMGGGDTEAKVVRQGPVELVSIDLLANSDTLWLETPAGVPFINGSDGWLVFLWPETGRKGRDQRWLPGLTSTKRRMDALPLERGGVVADFMDLEDAVDFAEAWVYESDRFTFNDKSASWRRNQKPSDKQVTFAHNLGIVGADGMTKARLSDEISIALASRVLDGHMS
ncbi:DNA helicase [Mycobacterium phage Boyle]|uniref:DNA helicase n=3 Tax=Rosebushvirus TaxID=1982900 RepID=S5VLX1_9CAUD|nr:DNA helicase [Mycobacterium phage TA17A]AEN79584.1 DNA helicase [Mycobacterium phage Arbiter]AGS81498.1 DNA helicase [Mycobacterium phage TA17A]AVR76546.1 DNA helicase [Mycobacterium phage Boyle]